MKLFEAFRVAAMALWSNKTRALLTMLGIIIGIGAVIGMQSIGNGFSSYMQSQFNALGVGVFYISPSVDSEETVEQLSPQLTADDAEAILRSGSAPAVQAVSVERSGQRVVSAGGDRYSYSVSAVSAPYFTISAHVLGAGRYFTEDEERSGARVAVIGEKVAKTLFSGETDIMGRRLTIDGIQFEIIGVLATKTNFAALQTGGVGDPSTSIYIPYQTGRSRLFRNQITSRVDVDRITAQAVNGDQVDEAIAQVTTLLRQRHRLTYQPNDFSILNPEQIAQQSQIQLSILSIFLTSIGAVSLLVGGIGIMNIMLVSVKQRTREIGLRKAVGARRRDILFQFLIEALVLCSVGGVVGIIFGISLSSLGTFVLERVFFLQGAQAVVTPGTMLLSTMAIVSVALIFGFFPAWNASRLNPIQALRQE